MCCMSEWIGTEEYVLVASFRIGGSFIALSAMLSTINGSAFALRISFLSGSGVPCTLTVVRGLTLLCVLPT